MKSKQEQAFFLSAGIVGVRGAFRRGKSRGEEKEITPSAGSRRQQKHASSLLRRGVKKEWAGDGAGARACRCAGYATGSANTEDGLHNTLYAQVASQRKKEKQADGLKGTTRGCRRRCLFTGLCFNDVFMILIKLNSVN